MATTNKRIVTTELDFEQIKANFKNYLRGQEKFSDYDFEGSALSILLDTLAYNTHYNALYDNLVVNESFLDSASKRASVVSKAKELGYVPRSSKCSTAIVDMIVSSSTGTTLVIPKNTPFTTQVNGVTYTFYTQDNVISERTLNQYVFRNMILKEGTILNYRFVVAGNRASYVIPNTGVDTTTLRVNVQDTVQSSASQTYINSNTILSVDGNSLIYFLTENEKGQHVIEFGDGIIGKALEPGNVVDITYMISSGIGPNNAKSFAYSGPSLGSSVYVNTTSPAFGGSGLEEIDSIKWNAPRSFAAQNRCVTLDDYKAIIYSLYSNARAINIWGGEQHDPPSYGDVYISVIPNSGELLTSSEKSYILNNILDPRKVVTVHPKFIDPDYIKVMVDTTYYYNPTQTTQNVNSLTTLVYNSILQYDADNLRTFGGILRYSALSRQIDNTDDSIKNSITTIKLLKTVTPYLNKVNTYKINIGNPIYNSGVPENSVLSSGIYILGRLSTKIQYLEDLPTPNTTTGVIKSFYYESTGTKTYTSTVGTVDYAKGIVTLNNLCLVGIDGAEFNFTFKPQSNDVVSTRNQIVTIPMEMIKVSAKFDSAADTYKVTSSRN